MANMSSISCATTYGQRLPVSARKGSRAAPSATRDGASYPQYAFQAAAISDFTSRITQQLIGRATERAAAIGADVRFGRQGGHKRPREAESFTDRNTPGITLSSRCRSEEAAQFVRSLLRKFPLERNDRHRAVRHGHRLPKPAITQGGHPPLRTK